MPSRGRPASQDEGETLIELIIAVAIMGIAVVAIVGGIATSILMSDIHRKQATAGVYVRTYAEAVVAYVATNTSASNANFDAHASPDYGPSKVLNGLSWASFTAPNVGFDPPVISVRCWDDSHLQFPTPPAGNGCTTSSTVQQLTLSVASADSRASESLVVVVRKP